MCNIIPFYSFPRSGATLLSTILNNHPDVVVTPEMSDVLEPAKPYEWEVFIQYVNCKFNAALPERADLATINDLLTWNKKYVFYRVWLLGNFKGNLDLVSQYAPVGKRIFLLRNFLSVLCSLKRTREHTKENVLYSLAVFEDFVRWVDSCEEGMVLHYEDLVEHPHDVLDRLFNYVEIEANNVEDLVHFNFETMDSIVSRNISGDHKIRKTTQIKTLSTYYKFEIEPELYDHIQQRLSGYRCVEYNSLPDASSFEFLLYTISSTKLVRKSKYLETKLQRFVR